MNTPLSVCALRKLTSACDWRGSARSNLRRHSSVS